MTRRDVRTAWLAEVLRSPLIGDACRVLLVHLATLTTVSTRGGHPMTSSGRIKVGRDELATALGVKPARITNRITEATRVGLLRKVGGGHNGQTAIYSAQLQGGAKGVGRTDTYLQPESLAKLVVGIGSLDTYSNAKAIPTRGSGGAEGIGGSDTIRACALQKDPDNGTPPAPERGPRNRRLTEVGIDHSTTTRSEPIKARPGATTTEPHEASA